MTELKACPFCERLPEIVKHMDGYYRLFHRCPSLGYISIDGNATPDSLITRWNTRTLSDRERKLVEAARAILPPVKDWFLGEAAWIIALEDALKAYGGEHE